MFERFSSRVVLLVLRTLLREVRASRKVQESLVDAIRTLGKLPPVYTPLLDAPVQPSAMTEGFIKDGDYLTVWMIEQLALEQHVPLDSDTDLELLAKERGWVSPEGKFLMVPRAVYHLDASARAYLGLGDA